MASILEVQKESAMPHKMKRATLVQGGITRLLNTSIELGETKQNEILSKYMKKLQSSNYNHKERLQILKSIKQGWKIIRRKAETGERPLHRNRHHNKEKRTEEKGKKKINWLKNGDKYDSVLFIPATPGNELKKIIEEHANTAKLKIKIIERPGIKLGQYLKKFDKTNKIDRCSQNDCIICQNSLKNNTKCRTPSIAYKITCEEC